jgi:hypothetical protein
MIGASARPVQQCLRVSSDQSRQQTHVAKARVSRTKSIESRELQSDADFTGQLPTNAIDAEKYCLLQAYGLRHSRGDII